MIKQQKLKIWQRLAQWTTNFWRRFGNMYTQKLVWYCDKCSKEITGTKHQTDEGYHLCEKCK